MSFTEWSNEKKKKRDEASVSTDNQPNTASNSNGSQKKSFTEWSNEKKTQRTATGSAQGWADEAIRLLGDTEAYFSTWRGENDSGYSSLRERNAMLLAQADYWRKQYAGNTEAIAYINEVVSALSDARQSAFSYQKYYSNWGSGEEYNAWKAKEDFISEYLVDPAKATSTMNYEPGWITEAKYRSEKKKIMGADDFQNYSQYVSNVEYGIGGKPSFTDNTYAYINNPDRKSVV